MNSVTSHIPASSDYNLSLMKNTTGKSIEELKMAVFYLLSSVSTCLHRFFNTCPEVTEGGYL